MDKKKCSKCGEWKELSEFRKRNKGSKDGYRGICKECNKIKREENKDEINTYKRDLYNKNKIPINKRNNIYYMNNKVKIKKNRNNYINSLILWNSSYNEKIKPYEEIRQNGELLEVKCAYCGKWYSPTITEIRSRLQAIFGTTEGECRLYCSNKCKKECPTYRQVKYQKGNKKATSREVQPELRQMVLARDNYTCQKCGLTQDELKVGLHCHHYEGINYNPIESADIDACITLCKTCHKKVHKLPGCSTYDMRCNVLNKN